MGALAALGVLSTLPSTAAAETLEPSTSTDIVMALNTAATPYPGTIGVSGADGNITDVNVNINLSHTFPDDVDLVLVSPAGDSAVIMSDACGFEDLAAQTFTFSDEFASSLTSAGPCAGGNFKPTNINDGVDTWGPPGGPGSPTSPLLSNFDGTPPNGTWRLFAEDDVDAFDGGTINSWGLTISTATAEVIVPGTGTSGNAAPYPSTKTFGTSPGTVISDVDFETPDFSHTWPDDAELLLVGPQGQSTLLMSDVCGSGDFINLKRIFDDEATVSQTDNSSAACQSTAVKPTDIVDNTPAPDKWPAPAPAGPYGGTLSVFDGLEGGVWNLFALDDEGGDSGFLTSWTLKVTTRDAADTGFSKASTKAKEGKKAILQVTRSGPSSLGPATLAVSTQAGSAKAADFTAPTGTLEFAAGETSKSIEVPIAKDKAGEAKETFKVLLSSPRNDARLTGTATAQVHILPANKVKFGKLKKDVDKGTAKLFVKVPAPGKLVLSGKGVKRISKSVKKAGQVALPIKAKGGALAELKDDGSAKVAAKVAFVPKGGVRFAKTKRLTLNLAD